MNILQSESNGQPRRPVAACLVFCLAVTGCAPIEMAGAGHDSNGAPVHEVSMTRETVLPGSVEEVFDFIVAEDVLPKILTGYGPLPAVVRTSNLSGPWTVPGSRRLVNLADSTTVKEQLVRFERPFRFAYRTWDFTHPVVGNLASGAHGDWKFEPVAGGTKVTWTYTFTATNGVAALPLSSIVQTLWRGYMNVCLENSRALLLAQQGKGKA